MRLQPVENAVARLYLGADQIMAALPNVPANQRDALSRAAEMIRSAASEIRSTIHRWAQGHQPRNRSRFVRSDRP